MSIEIVNELPEDLRPKHPTQAGIPILEGPERVETSLFTPEDNVVPADLTGRTLMLNMERANKYQCAYFLVTCRKSYATVSPDAQRVSHKALSAALMNGTLLDVTDGSKGIKFGGSMVSAVKNEVAQGTRRIFMGSNPAGKRFVIIPKTAEEEAKYLKEIEETGTISSVDWKAAEDVNMSPIRIYD